jgi:hypothetical protein
LAFAYAVGRTYCPITGKRLTTWVVIEPNNALRERIKEWARHQQLNMDVLEVAALKVRRRKPFLSRKVPRATSDSGLRGESIER